MAAKLTATTMQKSDEPESIDPGEPVPCQKDDRISLIAPRNDYEIDGDHEEQSFTPPCSKYGWKYLRLCNRQTKPLQSRQ